MSTTGDPTPSPYEHDSTVPIVEAAHAIRGHIGEGNLELQDQDCGCAEYLDGLVEKVARMMVALSNIAHHPVAVHSDPMEHVEATSEMQKIASKALAAASGTDRTERAASEDRGERA